MSGHTPGPWFPTFYVYQDSRKIQRISASTRMNGAIIVADNAGVCEVKRAGPRAAADAQLIAAAPEMLDALREYLDARETGDYTSLDESIRAIIRKATGD